MLPLCPESVKMATKHHKLAVYDELIGHLEGILFQIPVISFIDRHCLIFEPDVEDNPEYKKVWEQYKTMISQLLEGFREDCGLTHEQIIQTLKQIDKEIDLQDKSIFEQMFATESYKVFVSMMARKNTELQQQVILVILSQTGSIPDICIPGDVDDFKKKSVKTTPDTKQEPASGGMINEDAILAAVLKKSKEEYEAQQARQKQRSDGDVAKALELSQQEVPKLRQQHLAQQQKLTEALRECAREEPKMPEKAAVVAASPKPKEATKAMQDLTLESKKQAASRPDKKTESQKSSAQTSKPAARAVATKITNEQAAANWLAGAMQDMETSSAKKVAEGYSNMSPEELKQRQCFLKEQRDKLLKMKQEEREKRYLTAEKASTSRPMSARAGRSAMKNDSKTPAVDQKTLDMRKAIASRLKEEVIGKH